jgi:hypothetical protein
MERAAGSLLHGSAPVRPQRPLALLVASLSTLLPAVSLAADPLVSRHSLEHDEPGEERGVQLGARLGYSLPTGTLSNGAAASTHLSDLETASVPIGIDAGFRFSHLAYLGATVAWGPGIAPNNPATCPPGLSCFRQDAQLRVEGRLYFDPSNTVNWWMGFGAGWEVAAFAQSAGGSTVTATFTGPVFGDLQIGFDSRTRPAIGPYFGLTFAEFVTEGIHPAAAPVSTWLDPSLHVWFTLGLHGSYGGW